MRVTIEHNNWQVEAEVDYVPRTGGTLYDPPEGGAELTQLWINHKEILDPFCGEHDDLIEILEERAEELYYEDISRGWE